jgi:hypothetical protein
VYWRDIPAQVIGRKGRSSAYKMVLHPRSQETIDRAAMRVGRGSSDKYLEDWRRTSTPCTGDLEQAVKDEVARFEAMFDEQSLDQIARAGGLVKPARHLWHGDHRGGG